MIIASFLVSAQSLISNQILKSTNLVGQTALNLPNSSKIFPPPSSVLYSSCYIAIAIKKKRFMFYFGPIQYLFLC